MNTVDKLKLLLATCNAGVSIEVNDHRNVHETVEQRFDDERMWGPLPEVSDDVRARMIETNTIVSIQFYPRTPVSFFRIWHYDLDAALDDALECLRQDGLLADQNASTSPAPCAQSAKDIRSAGPKAQSSERRGSLEQLGVTARRDGNDFDKDLARVEQIRQANRNARPTRENPAWMNAHHDCAFLIQFIDNLWVAYAAEMRQNETRREALERIVWLHDRTDVVEAQSIAEQALRLMTMKGGE